MATPHNRADKKDMAKTVLMPGDPLRAKFIAENYLEDAVLVNDVRCAYAYTGDYRGRRVTVMASGMGPGSAGIYSHELYNDYDVEEIIRIGSCGALQPWMKLGDIVLAMSASNDTGYLTWKGLHGSFAPTCDYGLLKRAEEYATAKGLNAVVGPVFSSTTFHVDEAFIKEWRDMGCLCMEMEASTIYTEAALAGKKALAMMTVSDLILEDVHMTSVERQVSFRDMMETALSLV